jgi:glycosyltransferase involved in cell wall biosynthesis
MKIVMFSPAHKLSAIGGVACEVTRALLSNGHRVTVIRTEEKALHDKPTHDFSANLIPWDDYEQIIALSSQADACVYLIGDNYGLHRGCLEWLPRLPGIVCLHDKFLGNLFRTWALHHLRQADEILRSWYGDRVAKGYFEWPNSQASLLKAANLAPMTEWICAMACGVVTHSTNGIHRILGSCPGPVHVIPLSLTKKIDSTIEPKRIDSADGKFHLLTVGYVNPNKRVPIVIQAIGNSALLRERTIYRLVGKIEQRIARQLSELAKNLSVNLMISGEIDDMALDLALKEADAISCLRWPALETGSGSCVEALLYGKPCMVTDTGFYHEIPDCYVKKIDPLKEIESIQKTLEELCENGELRYALGTKAQRWARSTYTPENYAQELIGIILSSNKAKPFISAVTFFTDIMNGWGASENLINLDDTIAPLRLFEWNQ